MKKIWVSRTVAVLAMLAMQFCWLDGFLPQADAGADATRLSPIGPNPFSGTPSGAYTLPETPELWEYDLIKITENRLEYVDVNTYNADSRFLYEEASFSGFNFQSSEKCLISELNAAASGVGSALTLNAPYNGMAAVKAVMDINLEDGGTAYVRLTRNGVSLLDTDSGWQVYRKTDLIGPKGDTAALAEPNVSLRKGDKLRLEVYVQGQDTARISLTQYDIRQTVSMEGEEPDVLSPIGLKPYAGRPSGAWTKPEVAGLWEYNMISVEHGDEDEKPIVTPFFCDTYNDDWNLLYDAAHFAGYNFGNAGWLQVENLQSDADGSRSTGMSLKLNNPMNGVIVLSTSIDVNIQEGDTLYIRVTHNGKSLLNTESGWQPFTTKELTGPTATLPDLTAIVAEGDVICLEAFVKASEKINVAITKFDVAKTVQFPREVPDTLRPMGANPLGDTGSGAYIAPVPSGIWQYQTLDVDAQGKDSIKNCTYYEKSWGNYLFNQSSGAGYHFNSEVSFDAEIKKTANGYAGISVGLVSPVKSRLKASATIGIGGIPENSTLYVRLRKDGVSQVPEESGWFAFRGADVKDMAISMPEVELSAAKGDDIRLDVYMAGPDMANSVNITVFQYNLVRVAGAEAPTEEPESVTPIGKNPQKGQPAGPYTPPEPAGEWTYEVLKVSGNTVTAIGCDTYNESWGNFLYHGSSMAGYHLDDGVISTEMHKTVDGYYGMALQLNSPLSGRLKVQLSLGTTPVPRGTSMYIRITRDGETVYPSAGDWARVGSKQLNMPGDIDLQLSSLVFAAEKGDAVRLEYYFDGEDVPASLDTIMWKYTLSKTGEPVAGEPDPDSDPEALPEAEPDSVTPVGANPMGNAGSGPYIPPNPPGRWEYQVLKVATDGKQEPQRLDCNYYEKDWGKLLLYSPINAGYHFDYDTVLAFENHATNGYNYGMSLNLNTPMEGRVRLNLSMGTNPIPREAALYLRVMKNDETVYPSAGSWAKAGSKQLNAPGDIDFVLSKLVFSIAKGDDVRLEYYLDGEGLPDVVMSTLFAYSLTKTTDPVSGDDLPNPDPEPEPGTDPEPEAPVPFEGSNARFTSYSALLGHPLKGLDASYAGEYAPKEGPWNFELLDVADGMHTFDPDYITMAWDSYLYDRATYAGYHIRSSGVTAELKEMGGKSYGVSLRFVSQTSGKASLTTGVSVISGSGTVHARILKNGQTVWPAEGWETGTAVRIPVLSLDLEKGDEITVQAYGTAIADGTMTVNLGLPALTIIDNIQTDKTQFGMSIDYLARMNIDPYWSYEYALDAVNPTFTKMEIYDTGWSYYLAAGARFLGCGSEGYLWVANEANDTQTPENKYGIAAAAWTSMKDGYVKLKKRDVNLHGASSADMRLRITKNGEKVWPENADWAYLRADQKVTVGAEIFKVDKGDVLRFEATMVEDAGDNKGAYAIWDPVLNFSLTEPEEGDDGGDDTPAAGDLLDIFYGLSEEDRAMYMALSGAAQFDKDFDDNKRLAEKLAESDRNQGKEEPPVDYIPVEEPPPDDPTTSDSVQPDASEPAGTGDDETEEAAKRKKTSVIQRRIVTVGLPPLAIVGIVVGGVILIGGVIVIVLKKKGIIFRKKT